MRASRILLKFFDGNTYKGTLLKDCMEVKAGNQSAGKRVRNYLRSTLFKASKVFLFRPGSVIHARLFEITASDSKDHACEVLLVSLF